MVADEDLTSKARIRNSALTLFARHGEDAVTLRAVAASAGVAHGLVVHHFKTKAGLRDAVEQTILDRFDEALGEVPRGIAPADLATQRDARVTAMLDSHPDVVDYIRRTMLTPTSPPRPLVVKLTTMTTERVRELRDAGVASTTKPEAVQVTELLVRYLGALFMGPMVNNIWSVLGDISADATAEKPEVEVRIPT